MWDLTASRNQLLFDLSEDNQCELVAVSEPFDCTAVDAAEAHQ
jgi:hypothetical protein